MCEQFLEATDASFLRLEDACCRANDAWLCGLGTWSLTRHTARSGRWMRSNGTSLLNCLRSASFSARFPMPCGGRRPAEFAGATQSVPVSVPLPRLAARRIAGGRRAALPPGAPMNPL